MTPKEALEKLNNFISREKHIDSERNKTINKCINIINQALDRSQLLEKENQEFEEYKEQWSSDIHCWIEDKIGNFFVFDEEKDYNVHLYETKVFNELLANVDKLLLENQALRDKLYDENLELQKENQELKNKNAALKIKVRAWEIQSEKFKKIIDILKEKADIRLHILTNTDGSKIYEIEFIFTYYSTIHEITQQEYDLLKEVFG